MKIILIPIVLILYITSVSCQGNKEDKLDHWISAEHNIEIDASDPWKIISNHSDEIRMFCGLINETQKMSYSIDVSKKAEMRHLSDDEYFEYTEKAISSEDYRNRLIDEGQITFHGETYHQQIFMFYNKLWGLQKVHDIVKRDKDFIIAINFTYPMAVGDTIQNKPPKEIQQIDQGVKIFGN